MKAAEVFVFASIFSAYNRLMNNQSMKTLILLGGLLLATTPAKADSQQDQGLFWLAYTVGAGTSLCTVTEAGMLPKGYAAEYVQASLEEAERDPNLTPFKQYFLKGYQELKKIWPDCIK